MSIEIITPRMALRVIDEGQADQALAYFVRNRDYLEEWEPVRPPEYYTLEHQAHLLLHDQMAMATGQLFRVWMYSLSEPDRIIGSIALSNIVRGAFLSCHLGYRLDAEAHSQGYMTEGLRAVIDYAFGTLKLHRIEANIMPKNKGSLRVVQKLGFYDEGLARQYLKINGQWEDHIHMVLLNDQV
ncbi:GNAT family N-acetyltransferase [Cohnella nanjingensis]|uniref:GNAT family N-acetyltransferase n=1 Tax=Cohnella nanjingensis TaxID=1387779 RepID=A0A7X0VGW3_9BACL|nr:GNAT family N-acetyltransferase [Cohnella nanjingensis]MBB6672803.1 GNAT family N-acetyltransferase [Cohnella nanjingensis]